MNKILRKLVAKLPLTWQRELRRLHFSRQIRIGHFYSKEPEFELLKTLIGTGEWAIDVGANVGHYAARLSKLVGSTGRVLAFEPIADTFAILTWNLHCLNCNNVTLINAGLSDKIRLVGMSIPKFDSGMLNFYRAQITKSVTSIEYEALTITFDQLLPEHKIALVKIDVEGHEAEVLKGMSRLIDRDHPILILETSCNNVRETVTKLGYSVVRLKGSPNLLCKFPQEKL